MPSRFDNSFLILKVPIRPFTDPWEGMHHEEGEMGGDYHWRKSQAMYKVSDEGIGSFTPKPIYATPSSSKDDRSFFHIKVLGKREWGSVDPIRYATQSSYLHPICLSRHTHTHTQASNRVGEGEKYDLTSTASSHL